jgi:hypothetical protein
MHKIINRVRHLYPYIRFGNQIAILRGHSSKNHNYLWHPETHLGVVDTCDSLMNAPCGWQFFCRNVCRGINMSYSVNNRVH